MKKRLVLVAVLVVAVSTFVLVRMTGSKNTLRIDEAQTIPTDSPALGSLITWDHYLAWVSITDASGKGGKVVVHDLDDKVTTTIAEDLWVGGLSWVRGSKDTVVYLFFDSLPCDDLPDKERQDSGCSQMPRGWKVISHDLKSDKERELAKSGNDYRKTHPLLPEIEWPFAIWTKPASPSDTGQLSRGVTVYDLKKNKSELILSGSVVGRATINDGKVVFAQAVPGNDRWDLFSTQPNGDNLTRLTSSGKVISPRAANGAVAWQEPVGERLDPQNPKLSLWIKSLDNKASPIRLVKEGRDPFPGEEFALWISPAEEGGQLLARDLDAEDEPFLVEPRPSFGAGWWVNEDRAVWATVNVEGGSQVSTIHVARLTRR